MKFETYKPKAQKIFEDLLGINVPLTTADLFAGTLSEKYDITQVSTTIAAGLAGQQTMEYVNSHVFASWDEVDKFMNDFQLFFSPAEGLVIYTKVMHGKEPWGVVYAFLEDGFVSQLDLVHQKLMIEGKDTEPGHETIEYNDEKVWHILHSVTLDVWRFFVFKMVHGCFKTQKDLDKTLAIVDISQFNMKGLVFCTTVGDNIVMLRKN